MAGVPKWVNEVWEEDYTTIIAGGRDLWHYWLVDYAVYKSGFVISKVVSGGAKGIDTVGEAWSLVNGLGYADIVYADWDKFGKSAGYKRNEEMAEKAKQLIAVWDGQSKGTKSMIEIAERKGLNVYVLRTDLL